MGMGIGMDEGDILLLIRRIALRNAVEHDGKARADKVTAKIIAMRPDLRGSVKILIPTIAGVVEEINRLSIDEQRSELEVIEPSMMREGRVESEAEHKQHVLPPLPNAVMGSVVTRFPPEPNGYPHIGHAKAVIIDEEYARMYRGRFILRFDDTNPAKEKREYYDAILDGLRWLNVKPDLIKNTSDDIELLYKYAELLVEVDGAYVCTCKPDTIKRNRASGIECECRSLGRDEHMERWSKMFNEYRPNQAILRFKGDMRSSNTVMRDPTLFRIIEHEHPLKGNRYRVWPTYDFAASIEDSIDGVTHALRSKEYELRNELYYAILDRLGMRKPIVLEFSRLEFEGMPVSKRRIVPLIEKGLVRGWDDPRLPTLVALRRRGIQPEAVREFVLSLGFTKADTKPPFEVLEAINRKVIDAHAIRLFMVRKDDCIRLKVRELNKHNTDMMRREDGGSDISTIVVRIRNHPTNDALGSREVRVGDEFYVPLSDVRDAIGREVRLIDLYNVMIESRDDDGRRGEGYEHVVYARFTGYEVKDVKKVQWVSVDDAIDGVVLVPRQLYIDDSYNAESLETVHAYVESYASKVAIGSIVQFVRFGFCRVDAPAVFIMSHK
ncbi:MAG: glutamate--tRNA ligase [Candidatus Nitrosocaldus sp.]